MTEYSELAEVSKTPFLDKFAINLTQKYRDKREVAVLIGRDKEVREITEILTKKNKPNVALTGKAGVGKAIPNNTIIPTPDGFKRFSDLKVGDYVFDRLGRPTKITGVYPQGKRSVYQINLSDGRSALSDIEHLWTTFDKSGNLETLTLKEIRDTYEYSVDKEFRYSIPSNGAVEFNLSSIDNAHHIGAEFVKDGKLENDKLKTSDVKTRLNFLTGMIESGKSKQQKNKIVFSSENESVRNTFIYFAKSLGFVAYITDNNCIIDLLESNKEIPSVYIESVVDMKKTVPMTCIMVENEEHLFLMNDFIVTHNTQIVEGLASNIATGNVVGKLKDVDIWEVDLALLTSKDESDGGFQFRFKSLINEAIASKGKIILFIDEMHTIISSGAKKGGLDGSNILKPALARGDIRMIGATTFDEYRIIKKDPAFQRRFIELKIFEPSRDDSVEIVRALKRGFEVYHEINIDDSALTAAVDLTIRFMPARSLPDKAIDILDQASAALRLNLETLPPELELEQNRIVKLKLDLKNASPQNQSKMEDEIKSLESNLDKKLKQIELQRQILSKMKTYRYEIEQVLKEYNLEKDSPNPDRDKLSRLLNDLEERENELSRFKKSYKNNNPLVNDTLYKSDIQQSIATITGIPVTEMSKSEREKIIHLDDDLHSRVIGQDKAVSAVSYSIMRNRLGIGLPNQPVFVGLFLGVSGTGKRIPDSTPIPVYDKDGIVFWKKNGDLKVGDYVYNRLGKPAMVSGIYNKNVSEAWKVNFSDGTHILCDKEHLWQFKEVNGGNWIVGDTLEIIHGMSLGKEYTIPVSEPIYRDELKLNDKPWDYGLSLSKLAKPVILDEYKNASINQRWEFIAGVFDNSDVKTDMNRIILKHQSVGFLSDLLEVVNSLGVRGTITGNSLVLRVNKYTALQFFKFNKSIVKNFKTKLEKINENELLITSITKTEVKVPMTCIMVDDPEHLYIAGKNYIVTHNTELVKALADKYFGDEKAMLRLDMGSFQSKGSIARLIGSNPGESSYDESGGELTEWVKNNPYSIILMDEAEKAFPGVWDVMLPVFDEGVLTDASGEIVNFKNNIIIMTSNIGSALIAREYDTETHRVSRTAMDSINAMLRNPNPEKGGGGFKPEFMNRVDEVVIFGKLNKLELESIATLKLKSLAKRLKETRNINLVFGEKILPLIPIKGEEGIKTIDVSKFIVDKLSYDELKLGARPIDRHITSEIEDRLVDMLLMEDVPDGSNIYIHMEYDKTKSSTYINDLGDRVPTPPIIKMEVIESDEYQALIPFDPTK